MPVRDLGATQSGGRDLGAVDPTRVVRFLDLGALQSGRRDLGALEASNAVTGTATVTVAVCAVSGAGTVQLPDLVVPGGRWEPQLFGTREAPKPKPIHGAASTAIRAPQLAGVGARGMVGAGRLQVHAPHVSAEGFVGKGRKERDIEAVLILVA